nr:putative RNA-directed DNA polymerase, eukaryota, reverse transcriptase zinc-binding domain protein [Tanacetum cinerariifolium]
MDGFKYLVINTWSNDGISDSNGLVAFKKKLQNLKKIIREWVASKKSSSYNLKKEHLKRLSSIDVKVDLGCASEEEFLYRKDSLKFLGELERLESKDLYQKAKLKWALEGDENTGFFHGMLKKIRRQLALKGILKNGEWIEDPNLVKAELLNHFRTRFNMDTGIPSSFGAELLNPLSSSQRDCLDQNITLEEIKKAVWGCGGDRAPGHDGFTFKFFTTFWDLIEGDVVRFVLEFFRTNSFPKGCNSSFIALIPKVHNAEFVTDFRPISLIRFKNILDGPLILNEVLAWCKERNIELMVFKVDFEKDFDSLRWDFLDLVMEKLGFGFIWRSWIQGCLRNAHSSILVNGSLTAEFEKAFMLLRVRRRILVYLKGLSLVEITCPSLISLYGLKVNVHTSKVIGIGVSDEEISCMANVIGCGVAKLRLKYIGVLIGCNMSRCSHWADITQKYSLKHSLWKARLLSVGGRLSLIKSVLGSLPTYYMSIYFMPVSIRNNLESMCNKFFIGGDHDDKKMTCVKWKRCLACKNQGGIGISSIYGLNIRLLFKWIGEKAWILALSFALLVKVMLKRSITSSSIVILPKICEPYWQNGGRWIF